MCQQLKVTTQFGYKEAFVNNFTKYVWDRECSKDDINSDSIKYMALFNPGSDIYLPTTLALHLAIYLAKATNLSMQFLSVGFHHEEDNVTGLNHDIVGDVFLFHDYYFPYSLFSHKLHPLSSPLFDTMSSAILSLPRPCSLKGSELVSVFDFKTYCFLAVSVLLVSIFFRFSNLKSKITRRSFIRQLFEMSLFMSLEPRVPGLAKERNQIIRIIITVLILSGLLMRKSFLAQIKAVFAIEPFSVVTDLNEGLRKSDTKSIIVNSLYSKSFLEKKTKLAKGYDIIGFDIDEVERIKYFLNNESVWLNDYRGLDKLINQYPLIPGRLTTINMFGPFAIYYFPISTESQYFKQIYKWANVALNLGITNYIFKEMKVRDRYEVIKNKSDKKVEKIYYTSIYFAELSKHEKINLIKVSSCMLASGFLVAFAFFFRELYLSNCFGESDTRMFYLVNHNVN